MQPLQIVGRALGARCYEREQIFTRRFDQSPVANLNAYSMNKSVEWAGVGFGGNRIESFTLKRVRIYVNDQLFASVDVNLVIQ